MSCTSTIWSLSSYLSTTTSPVHLKVPCPSTTVTGQHHSDRSVSIISHFLHLDVLDLAATRESIL
jgi:hypothetical protein